MDAGYVTAQKRHVAMGLCALVFYLSFHRTGLVQPKQKSREDKGLNRPA
jgi:hypothetical protein